MPPHNNPAELQIRDGVVGQRNVRHQMATPEGREVFSRLSTYSLTCRKNGILPCRAVVEMVRDPAWDPFNPGPWTGRDWCVFDSPAASPVRPPGADRPARNPAAGAWPIMRALVRPPDIGRLAAATI